ncbi:peptide ABC transporter substrate-binding protein [Acidihalobacter aeolianus]|uniref:Peptide ABC transporter substrate-binding protein n=1 Tax=Acidihalobacter aeolianus TaxID=2792603 RepID=A0A1D8K9L3_9GAMM|nr:peptide ABC transporter substrate-binding protein [Acidihalobacter aeolianus]AOV17668.1 peptide ABC transporter substrate-binding protein [Acidihalobacter aeolianus]
MNPRQNSRLLAAAGLLTALAAPLAHAADPTPRHGGTVVTVPGVGVAPPAAVNGLNPLLSSSLYNQQAAGLMYLGLLWIDRHLKIDYTRSVASGIQVSADRTVYTVTLHKRYRWSDGQPVTAEDVAYDYHMIEKLGPKFPNYGTGGIPTLVKSFEVLGPYRFRITLKRPVNADWFELDGLGLLMPLPKQAWEHYSVKTMFNHMVDPSFFQVVDGPFKLQSFVQGRYVSFVPNPKYTGPNPPYIDRLVLRFLNTPQAVFAALRTGAIQIGTLPRSLYPARAQLAALGTYEIKGLWGFNYMGFNYSNPNLGFIHDVRVRQAMMHAIDQPLLVKLEDFGMGQRDYGPVPVDPPTFLSPHARKMLDSKVYDPALADRLLDEAGWKRGPGGIREKDGHKLAFTMYVQAGRTRGPTMIAGMLAQVGIKLRLREKPFNSVIAEYTDPSNKQWQSIYLGWSLSTYPSAGTIFKTGGALNDYHYSDPKLDKLIDEVTKKSGLAPLYAFQDYMIKTQPVIFLPYSYKLVKYARNIHGIDKAFTPLGGFNPQYLWVSAK